MITGRRTRGSRGREDGIGVKEVKEKGLTRAKVEDEREIYKGTQRGRSEDTNGRRKNEGGGGGRGVETSIRKRIRKEVVVGGQVGDRARRGGGEKGIVKGEGEN